MKLNFNKKIFIFVFLIIILLFLLKTVNSKIYSYENLIVDKRKELLLLQEYKGKYLDLKNKYKYLNITESEIREKVYNLITSKNLILKNSKFEKKLNNFEYTIELSGNFHNIYEFLYNVYYLDSFIKANNLVMEMDRNIEGNVSLTVTLEFLLSGYIKNKEVIKKNKLLNNNYHNPFLNDIVNENLKINSEDKVIKMNFPLTLLGIIGNEKKKSAIIMIDNEVKIVNKNFKNESLEIVNIGSDYLKVLYEKLVFKIKLGGNIGVMQ
ncbi:MAG: hypothetical protein ACQEQF_00865 [Bacillota bacterium]